MRSRPWRGYDDLRVMQGLALEKRRLLGRLAPWHVGDVAWGFRQHAGREHEWRIRLWEEDGALVAWSWLRLDRAQLDYDVHPDHPELVDEILAEPEARESYWLTGDEPLLEALTRHGYTEPQEPMDFHWRALPEPPEPLPVPEGFRLRTIDPEDLAERVAIHRDVWAPSRVTEESFANVMAQWPYRRSLDCVVEAPDGRFAAYCLAWPDDENRVGELEPVGVRSEFRRRGLGAAVCTFALGRLHEEGAREAIVYSATPPARSLYESLGLERHAAVVGYRRPAD